jgi:septum formation protein
MSRPIVLASTSRYRRALLDALGLRYLAEAPQFEEDHALALDPEALVVHFARMKAESLAASHPDALIIGSDQLAELDGRILTKPGSEARAVEQLLELAGRTHRLLTAVALHDPRERSTDDALVIHQMTMRPLTRALAEAYVAHDRPIDCAGAYKVEALGVALFSEMRGPDHTAIVGLPLTRVAELLRRAGVDLLTEVTQRSG